MAADQSSFHVVIIPNELRFYVNESTTTRQAFKIYNTYDFPIKFRVLCTNPHKYRVYVPQGVLQPTHHVEIGIELKHRSIEAVNCKDVFRVEFQRHRKGSPQMNASFGDYGTSKVNVILLAGNRPLSDRAADCSTTSENNSVIENDNSEPSTNTNISTSNSNTSRRSISPQQTPIARKDHQLLIRVAIAIAFASTIGLMLPLAGDAQSFMPQFLHLSPQFKQVLAFASGLSIGFTLAC